ncbi:hypothetical protein AVEN_259815-1 [Araneus ventricosus]|uniref:TIL domain-containing protein n=1 Tax=Araneus ventricosus TaxID=182803 RepID=A0A4Y2TE59_ARAVE|nr:hypothetical protein AVEN_259815-1 [Araneus ventricosus]
MFFAFYFGYGTTAVPSNRVTVLSPRRSSLPIQDHAQQMQCPEHEHYKCGTACQKSCESIKRPPGMCTTQCKYGCFCNRGYIRESDNENAGCIPKDDCPQ